MTLNLADTYGEVRLHRCIAQHSSDNRHCLDANNPLYGEVRLICKWTGENISGCLVRRQESIGNKVVRPLLKKFGLRMSMIRMTLRQPKEILTYVLMSEVSFVACV